MRKRVIKLITVMCITTLSIVGCGNSNDKVEEPIISENGLMGSNEPTDVNVGLIMGPPSMGLGYFMNEAENKATYNNYNFEVVNTDYATLAAKLNTGDIDIATLPSNVAPILYNNKELQEEIQVISIGNLGVLYVLTSDKSINEIEDLKGRTVYSIGEGGTPEYTFDYILEEKDLLGKVNFEFRATPFEVLNLLQAEKDAIALLPQPFVEVAKILVPGVNVAIDVTEAWESIENENNAESVTTVTVARRKFIEQHEQAVIEYLDFSKKSTDYTLQNIEESAAWTEKYETFMSTDIAVKAIPECSIVTISGEEMKELLNPFIKIMYDLNPDAVGGSIPDDEFYYIKGKK